MKNWIQTDRPLVSVDCCTYNHEKFIARAIEGFLVQETSFPFEVIIHDDASTDKTADVIREYGKQYPSLIKPIFQTENQYSKRLGSISAQFVWPLAKGKYIALCEGDDFWTDPFKLQKQVDLLEKNQDCSACFTNALFINEINNANKLFVTMLNRGFVSKRNIVIHGGGMYPSASLVFRKDMLNLDLFEKITELAGDELLIYSMLLGGRIFYLDEVTCAYRRWSGGTYSGISNSNEKLAELKRKSIYGYKKFDKFSKLKYHKYFNRKISLERLYIIRNGKGLDRFLLLFKLNLKEIIRFVLNNDRLISKIMKIQS